jgi:hypothetical protein
MPFQNEKKRPHGFTYPFPSGCEITANQIGQTCIDELKGEAEFLYVDRISPIQVTATGKN